MSYTRVIPRDLFNEASLLKCLGHLWLRLEERPTHLASLRLLEDQDDVVGFGIEQDPGDGSISANNVAFTIGGDIFWLYRPLNSRKPWPLHCMTPGGTIDIEVFNGYGELSSGFVRLLEGEFEL